MRNRGGVVLNSAGNSNTDLGYNDNPYIIHVAATTSSDAKASFSNYGNVIDIAAPGSSIHTTTTGGGYTSSSGTSHASPVAAGVVALIMAANPRLSPDEVEAILEESADDLGSNGWDKYFGHGRVNAAAAVQLATGGTAADVSPPSVSITSPVAGSTVGGTVPVDVSATDNVGVQRVELRANGVRVGTDYTRPYTFVWDGTGQPSGTAVTLTAYGYDAAGNIGEDSITVTLSIADTTPPVVTAPPAVSREATGPLTSVSLGVASAVDDMDGAVPVTADPDGPFRVGQHTVVWSATDSSGNTGSAQQRVTVKDTTPPVVNAPADITVQASGTLTSVSLGQATAEDRVDGSVTAVPDDRGPFPVGTTTVTWRATDTAGNTASAIQRVTVSAPAVDTPPVVSAPADLVVEASGPLTAVDPGEAYAVDDEDGPVPVSPDQTGPFAPGVHVITWTARDSAGNVASAGQQITVRDTTPPGITPPDDITVGASGFLTEVDLGRATAYDLVSGSITPVPSQTGPFESGTHNIDWSATDQAGNRSRARQKITVLPLVNLVIDQTVSEGTTVKVTAFLSGRAPRYPVTIPYSVSGSAVNPQDHDAADGIITISSGTTGGVVFHVVDDGGTGESNESVVFTLQAPQGAVLGASASHTVTIIEDNVAPLVDLYMEQGGSPTWIVSPDNGPVRVTALVSDANSHDTHSFDWSLSDNSLVDTGDAGDAEFMFDPQWLADGIYTVSVSVTDSGVPAEAVTAETLIRVSASSADRDRMDTDLDGIPDYLDAIDDPAILQGATGADSASLLVTEPGLGLRLGVAALAAGQNTAWVSMQGIESFAAQVGGAAAGMDDGLTYSNGFFDFEITGLPEAGDIARVVIPLDVPVGTAARYRKYDLFRGWQDFVEDSRNKLASAPGSADSCPEPGSSAYQNGLHTGDYCIQLTLEDGGPNDADTLRNGVIRDPGGIGMVAPAAADDGGSGGGGGSSGGGGGGGGGGCTVGNRTVLDPVLLLVILLSLVGVMRTAVFPATRR
jgi:hypothetical protein